MTPRLIANVGALVRGLATQPREVLLNRAHAEWFGAGVIAVTALPGVVGRPVPPSVGRPVVAAAAAFWSLNLLGLAAHHHWSEGRLWDGVSCQMCDLADTPDGEEVA